MARVSSSSQHHWLQPLDFPKHCLGLHWENEIKCHKETITAHWTMWKMESEVLAVDAGGHFCIN